MECPIAKVIREIRGAADYDEGDFAGAADLGDHTAMFDGVDYYLNLRRIELARFEVNMPPPRDIIARYREMLGYLSSDSPMSVLFSRCMSDSISRTSDLAAKTVGLICDVEACIAQRGHSATIPCGNLGTGCCHQYDLFMTTRAIVEHVNMIAVPSVLGRLPDLAAPPLPPRAGPGRGFRSRGETLAHCHMAAAVEAEMCEELRNVEKFYRDCAVVLAKVTDRCTDIIARLISF